jgi:hypothetical protein
VVLGALVCIERVSISTVRLIAIVSRFRCRGELGVLHTALVWLRHQVAPPQCIDYLYEACDAGWLSKYVYIVVALPEAHAWF